MLTDPDNGGPIWINGLLRHVADDFRGLGRAFLIAVKHLSIKPPRQ